MFDYSIECSTAALAVADRFEFGLLLKLTFEVVTTEGIMAFGQAAGLPLPKIRCGALSRIRTV